MDGTHATSEKRPGQPRELTGRRFGKLTVVNEIKKPADWPANRRWRRRWNCQCDCGRTHISIGENLVAGDTVTCGNFTHRRKSHVDERIARRDKPCCQCKVVKPFEAFSRRQNTRDGFGATCKECNKANCSKRFRLHLPEDQDKRRQWREANIESIRSRQKRRKAEIKRNKHAAKRSLSKIQAKLNDAKKGKQRFARRAKMMLRGTESRCRERGIEFTLTHEFIETRLARGCAKTGLTFNLADGRGPFSPSLDRIRPGEGYTPDNVQLVVWCYNAAKGDWSHDDVLLMSRAVLRMERTNGSSCGSQPAKRTSPDSTRQRRLELIT